MPDPYPNKLSDFLGKLTEIEIKTSQDHRQLAALEKKLETLQVISERMVAINVKIESLGHVATKLEQRDWGLEESLERIHRRVEENAMGLANTMKEVKGIYQRIDSNYLDIQAKLDSLSSTIRDDYLSNASFTKLQRNILWAFISAIGAIAVNILLRYLDVE